MVLYNSPESWSKEAAISALKECQGNITEANAMLMKEEETINSNFNAAVEDMVSKFFLLPSSFFLLTLTVLCLQSSVTHHQSSSSSFNSLPMGGTR